MLRKLTFLSVALAACALVACGGGVITQNTGGNAMPMNARGSNLTGAIPGAMRAGDSLAIMATLPGKTAGEELPEEGVGTSDHKPWGTVGGFTQTQRAQTLAFPPGTTITVRNLSKTTEHTFNFVKVIAGPPAHFPTNVNLSIPAHGNGVFGPGFASGPIEPGGVVKVKLVTPGMYLIGCAFHYAQGMQDVIVIKQGAKPGPQGPQPTPTPPSSGGW
jgi:plastocyanin